MAAPQTAPTNGTVLRWARATRGFSIEIAAKRLKVSPSDLVSYENGDTEPSLSVFTQMCRVYRRTQGVLLLPEPPMSEPLPSDFRTVQGRGPDLGEKTLLAIMQARHIQHFVSELVEIEPELIRAASLAEYTTEHDPEATGEQERERLGVSAEAVRASGRDRHPFYGWRTRLQEAGILVFLKSFPARECRGLSLVGPGLVPAIVVTSQDSDNGLTFSLIHEYGHILLGLPGSCIPGSRGSETFTPEPWCNRFAAAFLSPEREVKREVDLSFGHLRDQDWTRQDIHGVANRFRISDFAMALRLKSLGITRAFDRLQDDLYSGDFKSNEGGGGRGETRVEKRLRENGFAAITAIVEAVAGDVVGAGDASRFLGLEAPQIRELSLLARNQQRDHRFIT